MKKNCLKKKKSLFPELFVSRNGGNSIKCQSYDSHTQIIRLLNRQAYAKMSKYVADTFQIRQTYVTSTLLMRYQYASCTVHIYASVSPVYDQRHRPMSNVPLAYL